MLEDMIVEYEKAIKSGNKWAMQRIERDLAKLGMDKISLMLIVQERKVHEEERV